MTTNVLAVTTSWKGTNSTAWATSANWTAGVPTSSVDAIIGDDNFIGTNQPSLTNSGTTGTCRSLTLGTGTIAATLTLSRSLTVSGSITIGTNGTLAHTATSTSRVLSLTGNWTNSGVYLCTNSTSTSVTFSGTNQFIGGSSPTGFRRLTINSSSTTTLGVNIGVTNSLSVSGKFDPGAGSGFVVSGAGTVSVNSSGKLLVRATNFGDNYALTGSKTLSTGSTVDYAASGDQTVTNLTYSTLRISGGGVKTLATNLNSLASTSTNAGNLDIAAGTFDLATFRANRGTSGTGGSVSVAAGATLKIGGTNSFPLNYSNILLSASSTVEYAGTNQTVVAKAYGNLTLSGSNGVVTKIMPTNAFTVAGNLTASQNTATSLAFTAGAALTVNGNVVLGTNTTFNGSNFLHTVGGNWTNNGTFTGSASTITMNGVNTVLSGVGTNNFFNLTIARSGITADSNTSLNVAGDFVTTGAGTFTHNPGGTGMVTMSGAGKTISGTGITFNKLTVSGTNSPSASFTVADNLVVSGALTTSAGTMTLSGTNKTISGPGSIAFNALNVSGSLTTTNNFSLAGNLNVSGSFTATAGTTTFAGTTIFSGTANLFNATLNGTLLRMGSDATLRLAGTTLLTTGIFDVTNQQPNTIVYNSASSQTVYPITYDNLEIASGGTKSMAGNANVLGNLTIDAGAVFSGAAGGYTNYLSGNWLNYGSFSAGNSTVEFVGASDAAISGATTFNQLRVNKNNSALLVNLATNQTVATLDMASGTMNTSTNTLTITTTRTGPGHVLGTITRQHSFAAGVDYAFESPLTKINFASLTSVSSVTMTVAVGAVGDFPSGAGINRQYTISLAASGAYNATLRAYYQDSELNGNDDAVMELWHNSGSAWALVGKSGNDTVNNWIEQSSLTNLTGRWTMASDSGVVRWNGAISTAWEMPANWTIVSGSPATPPSTNDIVELGTASATYQPTITSAAYAKSISFGSAQAMTLTMSPGATLVAAGNVGGNWTNNVSHTINAGAQTLTVGGDLTLSDGTANHTINLIIDSGTVNIANDLVESGGANLTFTGAGTLNLAGGFLYTSGIFTPGSGTFNYTGSGAQVVGPVTYNQLVFNKPAGVATLGSAATVNANLTLTNGGALWLNALLVVGGSVTLHTNTTLNLGGSEIQVGGDWVCNGTLDISSAGEVSFNGTGAQSIGACSFHDFDIEKPSGTATLTGNVTVVLDADVYSGTLDLSTFTIINHGGGGIMTAGPGTTVRTAGGFPTGFAATILDPTSTVEYYGASNETVAALTYGNLLLANGTSNPKTLGGPVTVAGNLLIGSTATLAASTNSLTLTGNWTNNGAFTAGTGTVILNGTNKTVAGTTTFNNLTVPGSYAVNNVDITIQGNVTILGSYAAGSGTHTIEGDLYNSGAMSSTGITTFTGTRLQTIQLLTAIQSVSSGVVNFNGTVAPVLNSITPPLFANVNINNTGGIVASVGWTVYGGFTVGSGAAFDGSVFAHAFYGTVTNNGTMVSAGTLNFSPLHDTTLVLGSNFSSAGTVAFGGSKQITISSGALALDSVVVANTHAAGITPVSNWTMAGDLQIASGAIFHAGAGFTHTLAGDFDNNGMFDGGTSLVNFDGTSVTAGGGSTVFYNLLISGSLTLGANLSVALNFTNNGTFDGASGDLYFTGSSNSIIAGTTTPTPIDALIIAKSSSTNAVTLAVNVSSLTALTITSGTLDTSTYTVSQNSTDGGTLSIGVNGVLKIGGSNTFPTFANSFDPGSTVEYSGSAQTVAVLTNNYANLKLSGSGNKTLASAIAINGNVDISGTAKFNLNYASGQTATANSLTYAGAYQPPNTTYGSTSSSAATKIDTYFQGTGKLTVGTILMDHFVVTVSGTQMAKAPFTITIIAKDANNNTVTDFTNWVAMTETGDGAGGTASPTNSGYFAAGVLSGQSVTLSKAGAAVTISVMGTNTPGAGVYTGVSAPFTVNPATPDLSWATPTNIVYGTALGANQNNATSTLAGTYVYNPTNGAVLSVGTNLLSVAFTPTDTDYSNRVQTVQLVVTPVVLGITADSTNRIYGVTNPVFTYTASGFVNGDTAGVLSGSPSLTTSATTNSPVGSYVITNLVGTLRATNYTLSFTNGTLTVNQASPALTWVTPTSIVYGAALGVNQNKASAPVAGTYVYNPTNGTLLPAGTNLLSVAFTPTDTNYVNTNLTVQLVVSPAPLTITASNQSKAYGTTLILGAGQTAFASSGLVNGETIGSVTLTSSGAASGATVGFYGIVPSAATGGNFSAPNYSLTYNNGLLTVNKATPVASATPTASAITYGQTLASSTVSGAFTNVAGASVAIASAHFVTPSIAPNAGSTNVLAYFVPTDPADYNNVTNPVTVQVNPAIPVISVSSSSQTNGYKASVTFTATLPVNASGSVTFKTNSLALNTSNLISGIAHSLAVTNLPRGTNIITAEYAGDGNYLGSTNTLNQIVTNHPPVALTTNFTRTAGLKLRLFFAELTNNWSDVDGDSVTLFSLTLATTNQVNLATNSTQILYPNSSNVNDQISYAISDGQGGTNTGLINVVINPFVTGQPTPSALSVSNNTITTAFYAIPTLVYQVQRSTNLNLGLGWVDIATNTVGTNGLIQVLDAFSDLGGQIPATAYYRLKWHP